MAKAQSFQLQMTQGVFSACLRPGFPLRKATDRLIWYRSTQTPSAAPFYCWKDKQNILLNFGLSLAEALIKTPDFLHLHGSNSRKQF